MDSAQNPQFDSDIAETLTGAGKLQLADHARLMADNQRLLQRASAAEQANRDFNARVREAEARQQFGQAWPNPSPLSQGSDDMHIYIDSPVTVQASTPPPVGQAFQPDVPSPLPNTSPVAPAASKAAGTLGKLALTAAIAAGGGGGLTWGLPVLAKLLTPTATPTNASPAVATPDPQTVYDILPWRPAP